MANDFSKKIDIFFDQVIESFDALNMSANNVSMYKPSASSLQQSGQTFYRPMEMLTNVKDGRDMSGSFQDITELTVPSTLTEAHLRNVPVRFTGVDMNDERNYRNLVSATSIMLSNKVDTLVANEIANKGTLVVTNSGPIDTYDDVAEADTLMVEQQVTRGMRVALLNPRMAKSLAGNLASRGTMNDAPMSAYTRNMLPPIAGFDTYRVDYQKTLAGSAATGYLVNGASQNTNPIANDANGIPVDNRKQTLTVDTGTGAAVGDAFTIAGVNSVGHINKEDTGQLKTFRILAINGAVWTISPAIIPKDGSTDAQKAYANVTTTPADNAAITVLNTTTTPVSTFYEKSAVEIIHSDWNTDEFEATGKKVRKASTDSGVQIVMLSDSNIETLQATYRMYIWCNVELTNYEMAGIMLQNQV